MTGQVQRARQYAIVVPGLLLAGLITYKGRSSFAVIQEAWSSGFISTRSEIVAFDGAAAFTAAERTLSYFAIIWPALAFGVLIAAAVRTFIPTEWLARLSAGDVRGSLAAGAAGAPLMLCSCCVAPVFGAVYERSSRLGPSLAVMLASPSLNPAALILTFFLFAPGIAAARALMALFAVFVGSVVIERVVGVPVFRPLSRHSKSEMTAGRREAAAAFSRSLVDVFVRTVPAIALGVLTSMFLVQFVPKELLASHNFQFVAILATASIGVLLALPTFFEIPLALGLLAAGAPVGAAAALLFAGPAINLPSLLAVAKSTNWKVATALAAFIWSLAVVGGLLVNLTS